MRSRPYVAVMDRSGLAIFQDLLCIMVAMVVTSLLLAAVLSGYIASSEQERQRRLEDEARRISDALLEYQEILHEGRKGLFEESRLDDANATSVSEGLRIRMGFGISIREVNAEGGSGSRWEWWSGQPAVERGSSVTSVAIWGDGGSVRPAKVVVWTWGD